MSRRRPLEISERNISSGTDGEQKTGDQDDDTTAPMAVSEKDLAELCRMDTWDIKSIIRPDTTRIGKAFDSMMEGVKASGTTAICAFENVHCSQPSLRGTNCPTERRRQQLVDRKA